MRWYKAIRVKDVVGLPVDEQIKVSFLTLSYVDEMESRFLFILAKIILKELINRGEWGQLRLELARSIRHHLRLRHMGRNAGGEETSLEDAHP